MPPAARISDLHVCPMVTGIIPHVGGPVSGPCAPTVLTGSMPQARVSDMLVCVGPPDVIVKGSATVLVMGMPAARMGDMTAHGGAIVVGFPTVMIGDAGGGGGGGGGGGAVGQGSGAPGKDGTVTSGQTYTDQVDALTTSGAFSQPEVQARTNQTAAQQGTPFCETCKNPPA